MGAISSRDSKRDEDTVTEPSAGQEGAQEGDAEDKLLQNNGQISSLDGKTESQADESNAPYEEKVPVEAVSGYVALKEDETETTDELQEGEVSQVNTEELKVLNADGVMVKEDEMADNKQNDIEVGFTKFFRFIGLKFTLKKDKCDKNNVEEQVTNELDKNVATTSEDSRNTTEECHASLNEQDAGETEKDIRNDVQTESNYGDISPETINETAVSQISENLEQNGNQQEEITPKKGELEDSTQSPKPEEPMSPIKRFFTQGIFATLRKKRKDEDSPKENNKDELETTEKQEGENLDEAKQEGSTCICLNIANDTPEESKDLQTGGQDGSKPPIERELMDPQEQDKVPASPLKRLFRKLSTRRQRETKPSETNITDSGENLNEKPQSSTELITIQKEDEEQAQVEEPKPAEENQNTDFIPEELKKKSDSTVSWESLICIGSTKKRARKTSDSEDTIQEKGEEPRKTTESPLGSSTEGDYDHLTSSNEQAGSAPEEENGSTWKSLKKLVTPKRKGRMEESGSSEQIASDTEMTKDESLCSLKKLIPGRKKRKVEGHQDHTSSDETGKGPATDNEDDETPEVVPLSEYEIIEPASLKEIKDETEPEEEMQPIIEEEKPIETIPPEKSLYDVRPTAVPIPSDYIEDLTEFISKHQQLSDIPEEGIVEESVVTPISSAEWTTQDDTLAEDIVELTADAVTAPEPATEQFNGDETTEMVSAVSQLTESPETSGNVTPVPLEYDQKNADVVIQEVVETICMTPSIMSATTKDKDPEALLLSPSPCIEESDATDEAKVLVAHEKAEATSICIGLVPQEIGGVEEVLPLPLVEGISELSEAVPTELVSEEVKEGSEFAGLATDDIFEAEIKEVKTEMQEFLPTVNTHHAETEKEIGEDFQLQKDLVAVSKDVSLVIQEEEVKEYSTEAIHFNQKLEPVKMEVISAVHGENVLLEEQVIKNLNEIPETDLEISLQEPLNEQPVLCTEITCEKEHSLPEVKLSNTDVEQVAAEVAMSVAENVIITVPHRTPNEVSAITISAVTVAEIAETLTHSVVSEPDTTVNKASETTDGMAEVVVSTVEHPETPESINIVSPFSESVKVVAAELKDEVKMLRVPSLRFLDSHEIQVETKDCGLGKAMPNTEHILDIATTENVARICEKTEEIREGTELQIDAAPTVESDENLVGETAQITEVENLLEIVAEHPLEANIAVRDVSFSSVSNDECTAAKESHDVSEVKVDHKKEHMETHITLVEDHKTIKSTVNEVTPNKAEKEVENIQATAIYEKTTLQEESAKEGCQPLTLDNTEGTQPQNAEIRSDTYNTEAHPASLEESEVTENKICMVAEAGNSGTLLEDGSDYKERTVEPEIQSEIAKEPQEMIEAIPKPEFHDTEQLQTECILSKAEENQATESSLQLSKEDKQVAVCIVEVTTPISVTTNIERSNEIKQTCEVEKYPLTKLKGGEGEHGQEDLAEAVHFEALLVLEQTPKAMITPESEVSELRESSEAVSEEKVDIRVGSRQNTDTSNVTEHEVATVQKAEAPEIVRETVCVMEQKEEPTMTIPEETIAVSSEQENQQPVDSETKSEPVAVIQPEIQTQVINDLIEETLEVAKAKVDTHVAAEETAMLGRESPVATSVLTELEVKTPALTSVITKPEDEKPVMTSVVTELEAKTPVVTSVVTETEAKTPTVTSVVTEPEGKTPTVTSVVTEPEAKTPAVTSVVTEPEGQTPTVTSVVTEPEGKTPTVTSVVTEPETKTTVVTSVVTEPEVKTPEVTSVVTEPEIKTPVVTSLVTELVAKTPTVTSVVREPEVKTPTVTSVVTEPEAKTQVVTLMVKEAEAKTPVVTPVVTEPEVKTPVVISVVTEPEVKTPVVTSVVTEPEAKTPKVTSVDTEPEVKTPTLTSMVTEPEVKTPAVTSVVTEPEAKTPKVTSVVREPEAKTPTVTSVVTEPEAKTPVVTPVVTEPEAKTPEVTSVVTVPEAKTPEVTSVVTESEVKTPEETSVVTVPEAKTPELTSVLTVPEAKTPELTSVATVPEAKTTEVTSVITVPEAKTPIKTSVLTEPEAKTPVVTSVITVPEAKTPVVTPVVTEPEAKTPEVTSVVTVPEAKTPVVTPVVTEPEAKTPEVTSVVTVPEAKTPKVTSVVTDSEVKTPEETSVVTVPEAKTPEVTSVVTEPEAQTPVVTLIVTEPAAKKTDVTSLVTEPEAKTPEVSPIITEPATKTPEVTSVVTEPKAKISAVAEPEAQTPVVATVVTAPEAKTQEVISVVTKPKAQTPEVTSVATVPEAKTPEVTSVITVPEAKTPIKTSVLTEPGAKTPEVTSVVTASEAKTPDVTTVVTVPEAKSPVLTSVVTEPEAKTPVLTSVVTEPEAKTPVLTSVVTEPEAQTPVVTFIVTEPAAKKTEVTSLVTEPEAKTPEVSPIVTEPVTKTPEVTSVVTEPKAKTSAVAEPEAQTPVVATLVTAPEAKTQVISVVTKPKAQTPEVTSVVAEPEAKTPVVTSVVTEHNVETPVMKSVVTEFKVEKPVVTSLVTELKPKTPVMKSEVTELKAETLVVTSVETEPQGETTVVTSVVKELEVKTPAVTSVAKSLVVKDISVASVIQKMQPVLSVKEPAIAQESTVGERSALALATEIQKTTVIPTVLKEGVQSEVSEEKHTEDNRSVKASAAAIESKLETPVAPDVSIQTSVAEDQIPAVVSALKTESQKETHVEKDLNSQNPVLTSVKEVKELGTSIPTSIDNETQLKTPVISEVQTSVGVPRIQTPAAVTLVTETTEIPAPNSNPPITAAVVMETELKTPAVSSLINELEVTPVKTEDNEGAILASVKNPASVTPVVQTLTMAEPQTIPAVEPTVVQKRTVVSMVPTLRVAVAVKEQILVGPEVKKRPEETSVAAEVEIKSSLTEAGVKVAKTTEQVTQKVEHTAGFKEESPETVRGSKDIVFSMAKTVEPPPDAEDDVWEDAVDDIRIDEFSFAKPGVE